MKAPHQAGTEAGKSCRGTPPDRTGSAGLVAGFIVARSMDNRALAPGAHLIHWQSQSPTSADSKTGRRYIEHERLGYTVLLFARENKSTNSLAAPFYFLGPARYVTYSG